MKIISDNNSVAQELFTKANERGEFITMLFIKYYIIGETLGLIFPFSLSIAYSLIIYGDVAIEHIYVPGRFVCVVLSLKTNWEFLTKMEGFNAFSLPWNQHTFFGWVLEQSTCLLGSMAYFLVTGALMSLFIAICEFHKAFYKYLHHLVTSIDELGDSKPEMFKLRSKQILCQTIRFHVSAKE